MFQPAQLDYYFPFIMFIYGSCMSILLSSKMFERLETFGHAEVYQRLLRHRIPALICLFVGTLWSLQNLWLATPP